MRPVSSMVLPAGFVLALALLVGVASISWGHMTRLQEAEVSLSNAQQVRRAWLRLLLLVERVQSEQRGVLLTGEPVFLTAFESSLKEVEAEHRRLLHLTADVNLKRDLGAMEPLLAERLAFARRNVDRRQSDGPAAAVQELLTLRGKDLSDRINAQVAGIDARMLAQLEERAAAVRRQTDLVYWLGGTGVSLSLVLLIVVFALLLRENRLRSAANLALRNSEMNLAITLRSIGDGLIATDTEQRITRFNLVAEHLTGWTQADALGRPVAEVFHIVNQQTRQPATIPVIATLAQGTVHGLANDTLLITRDGTERSIADSCAPIHNHEGRIVGAVLIFRDVTQEYAMRAALRDFKAALDEHAIVAITDARGKITYVNDKFCTISRYSSEELIGQDHRIVNSGHHPKAFICDLWQTITSGRVWKGEIRNRAKDGAFYWLDTTIVPFLDEHGKPVQYIAIRTDITARKQAAEQIERLNAGLRAHDAELEAANKELESFAYSVSHDLRAPLRHVHGYGELLAKATAGQLSPKAARYLRTIMNASVEMGQLIDDLLAFSRMGLAAMRETAVDLDPMVQDTVRGLEMATKDRNIIWKISPLPPVLGDPAMLRQVFSNLIGNAVKYTRGRDPAQIEIGCAGEEDGRTVLFVRDNGAGFDMKYAPKLFGVFQRLHRAEEFEGTGIGLATVRRIMARHGGRVWAEGQPGEGATFFFTLKPAAVTPPAQKETP